MGTPAAFAPAHLSALDVNDLMRQAGLDPTKVELRLRRAAALESFLCDELQDDDEENERKE